MHLVRESTCRNQNVDSSRELRDHQESKAFILDLNGLINSYFDCVKVFNMIQKPLLPYEVVFYILLGLKAPNDQLLKYLALIDNTDYLQHIRDYASSNKLSELFIEVNFHIILSINTLLALFYIFSKVV